MILNFFNYSGSKNKYVPLINSYIDRSIKKIYCEPFIGSGAILFNLNKKFEHYYINDIDRNIYLMYKTFQVITYDEYEYHLQLISIQFGDISSNKDSYYNFRNWFNENHWRKNSLSEGIYIHILTNSCINSFLRFGPNGMNQSYGARSYRLDKFQFKHIQDILKKSTITNTSYADLLHLDATFYYDPPYYSQDSSYVGFTETDLFIFIDSIQNTEFIYTDILNDINSNLICNKEFIREMISTSPNSPGKLTKNFEYIFSNIEKQETMNIFDL